MAKAVLDAHKQVMRCLGCGAEHPLDDGVNGRPVWQAVATMNGFSKEHEDCDEGKDESDGRN